MRESLLRRRPPSMNLNSEAKLETLVGSSRFFWALLPRSLRSRGQIIFSRLSPPSKVTWLARSRAQNDQRWNRVMGRRRYSNDLAEPL